MGLQKLEYYRQLSDKNLGSYLNSVLGNQHSELDSAIQYSTLNGGKRIRAILAYGIGEIFNVPEDKLFYPACAVELIHAYSLVHDDLPAMDDSPLRRGKPSTHIQYDEATAILVGDALLTLAFECLSDNDTLNANQKIKMIIELARASGAKGMIAGQMQDLAAENATLNIEQLTRLHQLKTGKLLEASMVLGAIAADADDKMILLIRNIAKHLGLAFQIKDDLLDATGDETKLGKLKTDEQNAKSTYVSLLGVDGASTQLVNEINLTHEYLSHLVDTSHWLHELIDFIGKREN